MSIIINPYSFGVAFTGILDTYTGAAAAYSIRRLSSTYTGSALRVRRSSDNTEQDIGFTSTGDFDETALTTFVGANSGFITKWYDQSGNSRDASQTTTTSQPRIVNAGTVDKSGGKAALLFTSSYMLNPASSLGIFRNKAIGEIFIVTQGNSTSTTGGFLYGASTGTAAASSRIAVGDNNNYFSTRGRRLDANGVTTATLTTTHGTTAQKLLSSYCDWANNSMSIKQNGANEITATMASSGNTSDTDSVAVRIGALSSSSTLGSYAGWMQEILVFNTSQSSNRSGIESNINTYFSIY